MALLCSPLQSEADVVRMSLQRNSEDTASRRQSPLIRDEEVRARVKAVRAEHLRRHSHFPERAALQQRRLGLPLFPSTIIGSFPQTAEVRSWRARLKAGNGPRSSTWSG